MMALLALSSEAHARWYCSLPWYRMWLVIAADGMQWRRDQFVRWLESKRRSRYDWLWRR
jgi:hypothetical protein